MPTITGSDTAGAYAVLAPVYDLLTADYAHARWVRGLEDLARAHGLRGRRALDAACGTGKSFLPLLDLGYDVTACDLSPEMAARAQAAGGPEADVRVADVRRLEPLGSFDLVTCLSDVLNHLAEPAEVLDALLGLRGNLADGGLLVFDVNTLAAYRDVPDMVVEGPGSLVVWHGAPARIDEPGGCAEVVVDVFASDEDGATWRRAQSRQRHRHHPLELIVALVEEAGLEVVALRGQRPGGVLEEIVDEEAQHKVVVVAGRG
jgi:SAM-dependent methyltransferase